MFVAQALFAAVPTAIDADAAALNCDLFPRNIFDFVIYTQPPENWIMPSVEAAPPDGTARSQRSAKEAKLATKLQAILLWLFHNDEARAPQMLDKALGDDRRHEFVGGVDATAVRRQVRRRRRRLRREIGCCDRPALRQDRRRRPDLVRPLTTVNTPRKAPVVLSQEEVARLLESAAGLKYKAALGVAYGAGLRVSEVANLKVSDIDSQRMTLRVEQGKGQRDRYVMLSPQLLEPLREWWRAARPRAWLFPSQNPVNPMSARQLVRAVHAAAQVITSSSPCRRRSARSPSHHNKAAVYDLLWTAARTISS